MAAHRPIAHRAFSVLLVALLVGSVVAPIAASSPAAAQDSTEDTVEEYACYTISQGAGPGGFLINEACTDWTTEETTYDGDPAATQTTLHGMAVSEWETQQAIQTIMQNYGEDTETIASIEARNAIATAYESGNTSSEADTMAREAISDYYAQRQINTLEAFTKSQAQMAHIGNISNEPDIARDFVHIPGEVTEDSSTSDRYMTQTTELTGNLDTHNYTLANGTSYEYQTAEFLVTYTQGSGSSTDSFSISFDDWSSSKGKFVVSSPNDGDWSIAYTNAFETTGQINVRNSYYNTGYNLTDGLYGQKVADMRGYRETLADFDSEDSRVTTNYVDISSELFSEMDAGNLDPNELRGAEGMVRYLSGDSNATEGDYRTALAYTLDTSNPNLTETSTMKVHIDGYTGLKWNASTNETVAREPIPTDPMNATIEGLLFADGVSNVSVNQTYSTNATDSQSFYVIDENGTQTTLIEGNLTVKAIYDSNGNELENATYTDPKYDSYNASEFIEYLDENEEVRQAIISYGSGGDGVTIGDLFGNNPVIGLVVVGAVVALFIVGKAKPY